MKKYIYLAVHSAVCPLGGPHKHRVRRDHKAESRASARRGAGASPKACGGGAEADGAVPCVAFGVSGAGRQQCDLWDKGEVAIIHHVTRTTNDLVVLDGVVRFDMLSA